MKEQHCVNKQRKWAFPKAWQREVFWPGPTEKRPWGRLRRHWRDYWKCPGVTVAPDQKDNWQYVVLKNVSVEMMDLTPTSFAVSHIFICSVFFKGQLSCFTDCSTHTTPPQVPAHLLQGRRDLLMELRYVSVSPDTAPWTHCSTLPCSWATNNWFTVM